MPTPNTGIPYVPENTTDPAAGLNLALNVIDALLQTAVINMDQTAPPGSPSDGDLHIVAASATGAWAGEDDNLARYVADGDFWQFFDAGVSVHIVFNKDDGAIYAWTGSSWSVPGGGGGGASIGVQYTSDTGSTADSDPGPGLLKWNNATQASATMVFLDDATVDGVSMTGFWSALESGGLLYLQDKALQDTWQIWEITGVTDASGYVKLAVTLLSAGDAFADGADMLVTLQQGPAAGAVTSVNGDTGAVLVPVPIVICCSDETTALTTGTAKVTFRMPYAMTLTGVKASVTTAPTGSVLTVDINEGGASILSTKLTIDATEKTSTTAAVPAVISDSALAADAEITIDIDTVGSTVAGAGLKVTLQGTYSP